MATINYSDLELKKNTEVDSFDWNGKTIEIKKFLSVSDEYDIVMITLQKAFENGIYNPIKIDMYFHLNLIYIFTNIIFTEEQKQDEEKLFDEITSSGFLNKFLESFNKDIYKELSNYIDTVAGVTMRYNTSAAGIAQKLIDDLPEHAAAAAKIVEEFDPEKYQAVVDFAKAANNGKLA